MTTVLDALSAIGRGDPFAMRKAVDAMGIALAALSDRGLETLSTLNAERSKRR